MSEPYVAMNRARNSTYADKACDLLLHSGVPLSATDLRKALGCSLESVVSIIKRWGKGDDRYALIKLHPGLRLVVGMPGRPSRVYVRGWTSLSDLADYYAPEGHEDSTSDP